MEADRCIILSISTKFIIKAVKMPMTGKARIHSLSIARIAFQVAAGVY